MEAGVLPSESHAGRSGVETVEAAASGDAGESPGLRLELRRELLLQVEVKRLEARRLRWVMSVAWGRSLLLLLGPHIFFDVSSNLRLVPQFCDWDPDTFFSLSG